MHTASVSPGSTDILLLGNVTRDLDKPGDFSTYRLGGTVTFAAAVAARLGRRPTIITYAQTDTDFSVRLKDRAPCIDSGIPIKSG